jgi:2-iminobutanoate/2-iminopropanoate deaminase
LSQADRIRAPSALGEVSELSDVQQLVADDELEWLSVVVDGDPSSDSLDGRREVAEALASRGLGFENVAHIKFWVPDLSSSDRLLRSWLDEYPDRDQRPAVTLLASNLPEGRVLEFTVVASRSSSHQSIYEDGATQDSFPSAVACGDFFVVSTLSGADPESGAIANDASTQVKQAFHRFQGLLATAGGDPSGVAHMFVWYRDHSERETVNEPFLEMFPLPADRPCRHSVVRRLPEGVAMQIEAMGSLKSRRATYAVSGVWHAGIEGIPNSLPFGAKAGHYLFSAATYGRNLETDDIDLDLESQTKYSIIHTHSFLRAVGTTPAAIGHLYVWVRTAADGEYVRAAVNADLLTNGSSSPVHIVQAELPGTNLVQIEAFIRHPF